MNIEELWYGFWLIKAVVSLSVLWAVGLLCKWVLRCIPWNRVKRRSTKHSIVHLLGTRQSPQNFNARKPKLSPADPTKERSASDKSC